MGVPPRGVVKALRPNLTRHDLEEAGDDDAQRDQDTPGQHHQPAMPCDTRVEYMAAGAAGGLEQVLDQRFQHGRFEG